MIRVRHKYHKTEGVCLRLRPLHPASNIQRVDVLWDLPVPRNVTSVPLLQNLVFRVPCNTRKI